MLIGELFSWRKYSILDKLPKREGKKIPDVFVGNYVHGL